MVSTAVHLPSDPHGKTFTYFNTTLFRQFPVPSFEVEVPGGSIYFRIAKDPRLPFFMPHGAPEEAHKYPRTWLASPPRRRGCVSDISGSRPVMLRWHFGSTRWSHAPRNRMLYPHDLRSRAKKGRTCYGTVLLVSRSRALNRDHPTKTNCPFTWSCKPPPNTTLCVGCPWRRSNPRWQKFQARRIQYNGAKLRDGRCRPFHQWSVVLSTPWIDEAPLTSLGVENGIFKQDLVVWRCFASWIDCHSSATFLPTSPCVVSTLRWSIVLF